MSAWSYLGRSIALKLAEFKCAVRDVEEQWIAVELVDVFGEMLSRNPEHCVQTAIVTAFDRPFEMALYPLVERIRIILNYGAATIGLLGQDRCLIPNLRGGFLTGDRSLPSAVPCRPVSFGPGVPADLRHVKEI